MIEKIGIRMLATGFSVRAGFGFVQHHLQLHAHLCHGRTGCLSELWRAVSPIFHRRTKHRADPVMVPFLQQTSMILFDRYDRRFREGLELIL
jgi:TetR/AcrR family tetracycline transcriptional repressor